jgi:hypothetical protein
VIVRAAEAGRPSCDEIGQKTRGNPRKAAMFRLFAQAENAFDHRPAALRHASGPCGAAIASDFALLADLVTLALLATCAVGSAKGSEVIGSVISFVPPAVMHRPLFSWL